MMEVRGTEFSEVVSRKVDLKTARDNALAGILAAGDDFDLARALWIRAKVYNRGMKSERAAGLETGRPLPRAGLGSADFARELNW